VLAGDFNTLAPGEDLDLKRLPPRLRPFVWLSGGRIRWRTIRERIVACDVVRTPEVVVASDHLPVVADLTIDWGSNG